MISEKQMQIMAFPYTDYDALIADGAIRTGKTSFMMLSFVDDAMRRFNNHRFGVCGKTVDSTVKNIILPYLGVRWVHERYSIQWKRTDKLLIVTNGEKTNVFEVFGGKDEASFMLIQGRTLAGVLLDEVALQPRSFVEQALARCSVDGSKFWFNCNPGNPSHWFKEEWIDKAESKNALHLHFVLSDNPSLSDKIIHRYESMYTGVFYDRYIRGLWVLAEGLIYPDYQSVIVDSIPEEKPLKTAYSIDYGTMNAFACLQWELHGDKWIATKGYYYSGREKGIQKTDNEYLKDLESTFADAIEELREKRNVSMMVEKMEVIIDPSAASFIALLNKTDWAKVRKADNDVVNGIRETATCMSLKKFAVYEGIKEWQTEAGGYVWDDKQGEDKPVKVNDHYMDATRYFVHTKHLYKQKQKYTSPYGMYGGR